MPGTVARQGQGAQRLLDELGQHLRATAVGQRAPADRRARGPAAGLVLLFAMFNNVKDGLLVFTGVPFALTGGIVALWLRDIPRRSRQAWVSSHCPGSRC